MSSNPLVCNNTFRFFVQVVIPLPLFLHFEHEKLTNWSRIPDYRNLVTTVLAITFALICFMIVIKIFAWKLKNSGKGKDIFGVYDKSSGKIDGYDKWQLLLGYYSITFSSIIAQVVIWWIDYNFDLGFFVAFIYQSLALAIYVIFLIGPAFHYDFKYTITQFYKGLGIAIIPTLATVPFYGYPLCLRHFYFNFFLAIFFSEIQRVKNDQIKIFDFNTKDLETMENAPNRFAVAFLLCFSKQTLSEIVEELQ